MLQKHPKMKFEPPAALLEKWHPEVRAASGDDDATINIYSTIGEDYFTGDGMTTKIVSGILRRNKGKSITVNINSPGGDFFEGLAIYNQLREHEGDVLVNVIGLAGSAASVIAMAGDEIKIGASAFLMIHNAWTIAIGNKTDMKEISTVLDQFDQSMNGIYVRQSGLDSARVKKMMDDETFIVGEDAVEMGFATALLDSDEVSVDEQAKALYSANLRNLDITLARGGMPRSERRKVIKELFATPSAGNDKDPTTPSAGNENLCNALLSLHNATTLK